VARVNRAGKVSMRNQRAGLIKLEGGILEHTGNLGIFNGGMIKREGGRILGNVRNIQDGVIIADVGGQLGDAFITGDFTQEAGATLVFEIGGTIPGVDFSPVIITGHAALDGTLAVTLLNGFMPDPEAPDMFEVMQFGSVEGAFTNGWVDLGNDIFLDVVLDNEANTLTLVTRS
jgi:hypothetical protein